MVKRRSFLAGLLAIPAALWPFKAEARWPRTRKLPVDLRYYPDSHLYLEPGQAYTLKVTSANAMVNGISIHDGHKVHQMTWPSGKPLTAGDLPDGAEITCDREKPWIVLNVRSSLKNWLDTPNPNTKA